MQPQTNGLKMIVWANSGLILSLIIYTVTLSYNAGQRARQMDINTAAIKQITEHGSPALQPDLDGIRRELDYLHQQDAIMQNQLSSILMSLDARKGTYLAK